MKNLTRTTIALLVSCCFAAMTSGQTANEAEDAERSAVARKAALTDPTLTSKAQSEEPTLVLETTDDGTSVVATIGKIGKNKPWNLNLKLRAPVEKGKEVSLANLDGPLGSTEATLSFNYEVEAKISEGPLDRLCRKYNGAIVSKFNKRRGVDSLIDIDAGQCTATELKKRGWHGEVGIVANIEIPDALCQEYNKDLSGERFLSVNFDDLPVNEENNNQPPTTDFPAGYSRYCEIKPISDAWIAKLRLDLRKEAREQWCQDFNKRVSKAKRGKEISPLDCNDIHLQTAKLEWESEAIERICSASMKRTDCIDGGWDYLASNAFKEKRSKLEMRLLKPDCERYNKFDETSLLDSRIGECSYSQLASLGPEWEMRAFRTMPVQPWVLTISTSLAEPDFKFIDADTLESKTASEKNQSVSLQLGTLRRGTWWSLAYTWKSTFKAGKTRALCQPIGDGGNLACDDVSFGAPSETKKDIGQFEVKRFMTANLGVIGRVLYDFDEDQWNPHALLFFLKKKIVKDEKEKFDGLQGGLDLSYNDDDHFEARLFVGTKFDLSKP